MVAAELTAGSEWFQQMKHEENILKQQLLEQFTDDLFDEAVLSAAQDVKNATVSKQRTVR